jgi:protein TonB
MKQFLLVLFSICMFCLSQNASAQDSLAAKPNAVAEEEWDMTFVKVVQDGEFKGGDSAWQKYLEQHLVYPKKAKRKKIQGTVTVQFILDKWGTVTEVKALSGPEELRKSAVDVVMRSPKWFPAMQSGRQVKAYKKRDIVFKLEGE